MPKIQVTIVPRQIGQIWDQLLEHMLNDVTQQPVSYGDYELKQLIPNHYYSLLNVYQGQCYQQYTSNLCGYHATFNALCCLNMYLNIKSSYSILSGGSFWKFKLKLQRFLLQIKNANRLQDKWPWRQNDIKNGDFQRTYNKICVQLFDDFDIYKQNHNNFTYISSTWQFQYSNILLSEENRLDMNRKIQIFNKYTGMKPLIYGIMMGITCHWTYLVAFKTNKKTQYWFFDSHNQKELEYNQTQMQLSVEKFNQQRINKNNKSLTNFQIQKYITLIKDTQISIKLLVDCLQGKYSIDKYAYNQLLNVFVSQIQQAMKINKKQILLQVVKDYWYNINAFFRQQIKWELLSQQSVKKINLLIQLSQQLKDYNNQGRNLYQLLKKHKLSKGLF